MKLLKRIFVFTLLVAMIAGCSSNAASKKKEKEITVMLDWYPNAVHSFIYAAIEKGYFKEEGVKVNIKFPSNPTDPLTLAAAGKVTVGLYYQPDVVIARANEQIPVKSIGAVVRSPLNHVVSLKSAGIQSPKDLEGKTVGYSGTPLSEAYLKTMIKEDGGNPDNVKVVDVGFDLVPALITKKVDAVTGAYINHEVPVMRHQGHEPAYFNPADYGVPNYHELVFVTGDKTLKKDKEALQAFLRGAKKGYDFMKKNPDEALNILLDHQEKENFPLVPEVEKESMKILLEKMETKDEPFLSDTKESWEKQNKWLKEKGMTKEIVPANELFENILK
ncbi:ABC transporter substrate-binding protein [Bacillus pseudomycoides]|uniref:ABC transporter substrate-binding protein n=1 Tax=Bacillus pseudomycoides TaxID=64104 RepID=A0AA91ZRT0_9BACI|nr:MULTISPECIES: ABC transporter substrate-binding protein [Bacillus]PEB52034.1 ABC transporter substrate-binding protein [Bacillus sp. AFS098217]PED80950.1 ABC transporter substrate-binding protein [Bacillus pseudomycoides]PEU14234.1 ABC transporter substrate-binding protein [Bacillus sp. AFS019443]PEU16869.1 ABC transporter substrate-binding protein [Bacillus sp. AFS014408]PFW62780.1 ABC transporter substrate-binding protein [Bacillus sp. AFS075034]